jgi:hypothetical protein
MPGNGSVLQNIITRVRIELDEAEVDAKYSDSYLMENVIPGAMSDVLERLNADRKNKIVCIHQITTVTDQQYYRLPENLGQVMDLFFSDNNGNSAGRVGHRNKHSPFGVGYAIQGNELELNPPLPSGQTLNLVYMPTGGFMPHYATDGLVRASSSELVLSATPTLGVLDRREGAYTGQVVRIIPDTGPIETAVVESHTYDGDEWVLSLRRPLSYNDVGYVAYEIVDQPTLSLIDSVVYAAIIRIISSRRVNSSVLNNFRIMYNQCLKTEGDRVANFDLKSNVYNEATRYRNPDPSYGIFGAW